MDGRWDEGLHSTGHRRERRVHLFRSWCDWLNDRFRDWNQHHRSIGYMLEDTKQYGESIQRDDYQFSFRWERRSPLRFYFWKSIFPTAGTLVQAHEHCSINIFSCKCWFSRWRADVIRRKGCARVALLVEEITSRRCRIHRYATDTFIRQILLIDSHHRCCCLSISWSSNFSNHSGRGFSKVRKK